MPPCFCRLLNEQDIFVSGGGCNCIGVNLVSNLPNPAGHRLSTPILPNYITIILYERETSDGVGMGIFALFRWTADYPRWNVSDYPNTIWTIVVVPFYHPNTFIYIII